MFGISVFLDKKVGNDLTCTLYLEYSTIIYRTPLWVHARERKKDKKKKSCIQADLLDEADLLND